MTIDPAHNTNQKEFHDLLLGVVSPRPIALASTVDFQGNVNLSPFSFFNIFSTQPAVLVFSPSRRQRDNTTKHTLENLLETKEVVINTVNFNMVEQISLASADYPKGVNEFVKAGLTEIKSERVRPPRVKESPASFECRVLEVKPLGDRGGAGNLAICEIIFIHVRDDIFTNAKVDPAKVDSVARMGGDYYCRASDKNIFELPRPASGGAIGFDQLPGEIRNSSVLTGNNLARLANIQSLPSSAEITAFAKTLRKNETNKAGDKHNVEAIHKQAQVFLENGEIKKAWLLLLSNMHGAYGTE